MFRHFFRGPRLNPQTLPIGGQDGLAPNFKLIEHGLFGSIITSRHNIVRFYQDGLPLCYNAAMAMYMHSTQPAGTIYKEMAYHDSGRTYNHAYDETRVNFESQYQDALIRQSSNRTQLPDISIADRNYYEELSTSLTSKWIDNFDNFNQTRFQAPLNFKNRHESASVYYTNSGLLLRNIQDNNLSFKTCMSMGSSFDNPNSSFFNYLRYVQAFERMLSHGPLLACSKINKKVFPHYPDKPGKPAFHAYLIYGIAKYIYKGSLEAVLVCVDPNYPEGDTFIPILTFADQEWAGIASLDKSGIRPNYNTVAYAENDLAQLELVITMGQLDLQKKHTFYRHSAGSTLINGILNQTMRRVKPSANLVPYRKTHKVIR